MTQSSNTGNYIDTRLLHAAYWFLAIFVPFVICQISAYLFLGIDDLVDKTAMADSINTTLVMILTVLASLLIYFFAKKYGLLTKNLFYAVTLFITVMMLASAIVHTHLAGSFSSPIILLVFTTWLLMSRFLRWSHSLAFFISFHVALVAMVTMEVLGVIEYAPLVKNNESVRAIFLDWRTILMSIAIYITNVSVVMVVLIINQRSVKKIHKNLETANVALKEQIEERKALELSLKRLATTDPLTGAHNRRHFLNLGEEEIKRSKRYKHPTSVIMMDLDHFKSVNDTYGHGAGDQSLTALVEFSKSSLRDSDIFGRLGGEEFGIVLPETDLETAIEVANRQRIGVQNLKVNTDKGVVNFTISIGVTTMTDEDASIETLLQRADDALYKAKGNGRNRVEVIS